MIVSINSKNNERYINRFKEASKDLQEYFSNLYNTYADIEGTKEELVLKDFLIKIEPNIVKKINDASNDDETYSSIDNIKLSEYPTILEPIFKNIYTEDDSNRLITTLNDYFCYITDLTKTLQLNKYFILPLDEEPLMIDADARTIIIPSSIKKNGLAVQGDDRAEMVHFEIDRYFDNIDLGSPDIKIYIQYETAYTFPKDYNDEQRAEMEFYKQGFVPEAFREIVYDQDGIEKVVFGWLLDKYITKTPGPIKFAVHFLQGDLNEDILTNITYKLSTLTVQSTINKTLPTENIKIYPVKDPSQLIKERLVDSVFNEEGPQPAKPEFYNDLGEEKFSSSTDPSYKYDYFDIGQEAINGVKYKDEGNKIELSVYAGSDDTGSISYEWKKIPNDNTVPISLNGQIILAEVEEQEKNEIIDQKAYYDENGNYVFYPESEEKLYDKKSYCEVEPVDGSFVGKYYAIAYNRLGQKEPGKMESNRIIIPGPAQPKVTNNIGTYYHVLKSMNGTLVNERNEIINGFTIEAEAEDTSLYLYEGAAKDELTYQWQKSENPVSESDINKIKTGTWDTNGNIVENNIYKPQELGWYTVKVIANRNGGVNGQDSNVFYRYTELPDKLLLNKEKPEMYSYEPVTSPEEEDFDNYYILDEDIYIKAEGKENYNPDAGSGYYFERVENEEKVYISQDPLKVEANTKNKKSDSYTIKWYKKDGTLINNDTLRDGKEIPIDILKEDGIFGSRIYCKVINKYNGMEVEGPESCFFDINE